MRKRIRGAGKSAGLSVEPLDPVWRQDAKVILEGFRSVTWAERIENL